MADGRERTAQEREAARRERELRRAGVFNQPDQADSLPPIGRRARPSADEPDPDADRPGDEQNVADGPAYADELEYTGEPGDEQEPPEDEEHDGSAFDWPDEERPSGTRRVSRAAPQSGSRRARSTRSQTRSQPQSRPRTQPRRQPPRRGRAHSWLARGVALVVLVIVAALLWLVAEVFQPFGTSPHGQVTVVVPAHSGARQIGDMLARRGVVSSGLFFDLRATVEGERDKLRAGTYHLQDDMSYGAVLTKLTTPPPAVPTTQLTITEGHPRQYVSTLLRRQGIKGSYLAATRSSPLLNPRAYGAPRHVSSLEGFLFPDTFRLVKPVKLSALVADQLRDFKQRFAGVNLRYARSKHLTPYDVLKIASLIEGEAATPHDLPLVASVIYNRLADGMALQLDSTTRYATGNFTKPLTQSQLHNPSPYNTRVHTGLPPTPINSPGLAAIQAAAHPAKSHYLYFFTRQCTNRNVFTSSYTRFLNLEAADARTRC